VKKTLVSCSALVALIQAISPASPQTRREAVPASVALFYDALNAAPGKDVASIIMRATATNWVSCGTNEVCSAREQVIAAVTGRHQAIPDLRWEIKEVFALGNRIVVRGEASGTPAADFMGVSHGGKSFKIMSIDVHSIEGGKLARSYHVEDWMGATRQLSAK
jgi:predicted ester cyclase